MKCVLKPPNKHIITPADIPHENIDELEKQTSQSPLSLVSIKSDPLYLARYLGELYKSRGKTLGDLIDNAQSIVPELSKYPISKYFEEKSLNKGLLGQIIEYVLFGQERNSSSEADLLKLGRDIKVTQFKIIKKGGYNADNRVTLTNIGNKDNPKSYKPIIDNESFKDLEKYKKMQKGILFVLEKKNLEVFDDLLNMKFLGVVLYDLEDERLGEYTNRIQLDYDDIKSKVIKCSSGKPGQSGQKYIHICPHGSQKTKSCAFAFSQKFVTILFAIFSGNKNYLVESGRSLYINNSFIEEV